VRSVVILIVDYIQKRQDPTNYSEVLDQMDEFRREIAAALPG
jgi:hypothetical protein